MEVDFQRSVPFGAFQHLVDILGGHALTRAPLPDGAEEWSRLGQVECLTGRDPVIQVAVAVEQHHLATPAALALADQDHPRVQVDVPGLEVECLGNAEPGVRQHGQQRLVPSARDRVRLAVYGVLDVVRRRDLEFLDSLVSAHVVCIGS